LHQSARHDSLRAIAASKRLDSKSKQGRSAMTKPFAPDGGIYCYVMTPFDARGDVNAAALTDYVAAMIDSGVDGVTCIASTCEGPYLTERERQLVASTVGKAAAGRVRVNIGVGAVSTRQTIEYARQARDAGATSLMVDMQQYFPIGFDDAMRHFEAITRAVPLPIRLYNITNPTRFDFTPDRVAQMASIEAIDSVKESSGDVTRVRDIRALCGDRFALFCGFHFQVLDACRFGATGWEAGLHPLIARPCVELFRALSKDPESDAARTRYQRLQALFYFFRYNGVPHSLKAMSRWSDLDLGAPRAPLAELPEHSQQRLKKILHELDIPTR
jgi:4-hydroxy-tetrahydrodipicolinate synthase